MKRRKWTGAWIGTSPDFPERRVACFRKRFVLTGGVRRALWRIAAGGFVELSINGKRIDDHLLDPAFTDYSKTLLYLSRDVTQWLCSGENTLEVLLGNGWFNPCLEDTWQFHRAHWRGRPRFLGQLEYEDAAGHLTVIPADDSWEYAASPILESDMRIGETYDARIEPSIGSWRKAVLMPSPGGQLRPQLLPPIRTVKRWDAKRMDAGQTPGYHLYDAGRNVSGFVRIRVRGNAGDRARINYFERLDGEGHGDNSRINEYAIPGRAFQEDCYILRGSGLESWHPRFVYHGFRYVEIRFPETMEIINVEICWNHTDLPVTGEFVSSDPLLNRIQELCVSSFLCNFQGLPIDCPHREKNGWTGDAKIAVHCGLMNFDMDSSYRKWLDDCRDAMRSDGMLPGIVPSPGWGFEWGNGPCWDVAYPYIAWQLYVHSGDRSVLERHYPSLRRYGDFLAETKRNEYGLVDWGLADWVPPYGTPMEYTAPREFFSSAYAVLCWRLLRKISTVLGFDAEAERYASYAESCRTAVNLRYYNPVSGEYADGSQSAQAVALHLEIPDLSEISKCREGLVRLIERDGGGMNCGVLGTESILHALTEGGGRFHELAWSLATRHAYPSWGYMVDHGASTLWESWQGNSSWNHVLFCDISHWFYRALGGIVPDECNPGFRHYRLQPRPAGNLQFVKCAIRTPYGGIHVAWHRTETEFFLSLTQPEECSAAVVLPDGSFREARLPHGEWCCRLSVPESQSVSSAARTQMSHVNPEQGTLYSSPGLRSSP